MKVLITGATGLIGKEIVRLCLARNIQVNYLTTSKSKIENTPNYKGFYWNIDEGVVDSDALLDVEAVIHLSGAPISKRWTKSYKAEIIDSRILSTNLLFTALQKNEHCVTHFISASGINIYPSSFKDVYTEKAQYTTSDSFLSNVVLSWEEAVDRIENLHIKVSKIRTGMVLSNQGGALPKLIKNFKFGLGAPIGNGKQWQSWIHITDLANLYIFVLQQKISGTFNAVAPQPVTNKEFTHVLAKHLGASVWLPNIPEFSIKLLLGEMAALLLESLSVSSQKIQSKGFAFQYPTLQLALKNIL